MGVRVGVGNAWPPSSRMKKILRLKRKNLNQILNNFRISSKKEEENQIRDELRRKLWSLPQTTKIRIEFHINYNILRTFSFQNVSN